MLGLHSKPQHPSTLIFACYIYVAQLYVKNILSGHVCIEYILEANMFVAKIFLEEIFVANICVVIFEEAPSAWLVLHHGLSRGRIVWRE